MFGLPAFLLAMIWLPVVLVPIIGLRIIRLRVGLIGLSLLTVRAVPVTLRLTLAVLSLLFFTTLVDFALRLGQQARVVFRMLLEVFRSDPVIA